MTRRDFLYACGIIVLPQLPEPLFVRIGMDFGNPPAMMLCDWSKAELLEIANIRWTTSSSSSVKSKN
jgi:hypothetical protein